MDSLLNRVAGQQEHATQEHAAAMREIYGDRSKQYTLAMKSSDSAYANLCKFYKVREEEEMNG